MAFRKKVALLLALLVYVVADQGNAARELAMKPRNDGVAARVDGSTGGVVDCWNALKDIKSCSNEIILYFVNGETDIGTDCCKAIGVITHQCWSSMFTSLGFTAEEGNILRGYCDAELNLGPASAPVAAASAGGIS